LTNFIYFLVVFLTSVYTISYGVFEWKENKRVSAVAAFLISICSVLLPFIRIALG